MMRRIRNSETDLDDSESSSDDQQTKQLKINKVKDARRRYKTARYEDLVKLKCGIDGEHIRDDDDSDDNCVFKSCGPKRVSPLPNYAKARIDKREHLVQSIKDPRLRKPVEKLVDQIQCSRGSNAEGILAAVSAVIPMNIVVKSEANLTLIEPKCASQSYYNSATTGLPILMAELDPSMHSLSTPMLQYVLPPVHDALDTMQMKNATICNFIGSNSTVTPELPPLKSTHQRYFNMGGPPPVSTSSMTTNCGPMFDVNDVSAQSKYANADAILNEYDTTEEEYFKLIFQQMVPKTEPFDFSDVAFTGNNINESAMILTQSSTVNTMPSALDYIHTPDTEYNDCTHVHQSALFASGDDDLSTEEGDNINGVVISSSEMPPLFDIGENTIGIDERIRSQLDMPDQVTLILRNDDEMDLKMPIKENQPKCDVDYDLSVDTTTNLVAYGGNCAPLFAASINEETASESIDANNLDVSNEQPQIRNVLNVPPINDDPNFKFKCEICDIQLPFTDLIEHCLTRKHYLYCHWCPVSLTDRQIFLMTSGLYEHIYNDHIKNDPSHPLWYRCNDTQCMSSKPFRERAHLFSHLSVQHFSAKRVGFSCNKCLNIIDKKNRATHYYKEHLLPAPLDRSGVKFTCLKCGQVHVLVSSAIDCCSRISV